MNGCCRHTTCPLEPLTPTWNAGMPSMEQACNVNDGQVVDLDLTLCHL